MEIVPSQEQEDRDYFSPDLVKTLNCISFQNNLSVYHVPIEDIINKLIDQFDDIGSAEQNHSDLISGVYEGEHNFFAETEKKFHYINFDDVNKKLI